MALISVKHLQISKANTNIIIVISIASFVTIFSLFATRALLSQRAYQQRVIDKKTTAAKQLKENVNAVNSLKNSYDSFVSEPVNIIQGNAVGTSDRDGDSAKITLDALPSTYDFPALTSSMEKLFAARNARILSLTGSDDEVAQKNKDDPNPVPIEIPFSASVAIDYNGLIEVLRDLEKSIRPFQPQSLTITASTQEIQLLYEAKTYYLPEKNLSIKTEEVK